MIFSSSILLCEPRSIGGQAGHKSFTTGHGYRSHRLAHQCSALTPVLHDILRSKWVAKRKEHCGSNGQLKPGWAQEFYDWTRISVTSTGAPVFVRNPRCPWGHKCKCERDRSELATTVLNEMRWCGYTPWSAIHAVRCCEERLLGLRCSGCRKTLLTYCTFLMEHAALEASREGDWLVRNEAVIQLCWALWGIHSGCESVHHRDSEPWHSPDSHAQQLHWDDSTDPFPDDDQLYVWQGRHKHRDFTEVPDYEDESDKEENEEDNYESEEDDEKNVAAEAERRLLEGWAKSIVTHCVAFQAQERQDSKRTLSHIERLAVLYAIDHLPLTSGKPESVSPLRSDAVDPADLAPDSRLSEVIMSNVPFTSAKRSTSSVPDEEDLRVSPVGETMLEVPDRMEVRNGDPEAIAEAMVSCFPRVSVSALCELTLKAPDPSALRSDPRILWPVFVNPTRACYRLYKSVALPVAPNPAYALEILARS
ncbi:hypothetical protein F2P81_024043 [Scophthalmus maximus]|uniref:Uncharacterized protein n=1 Tax=Scophthalmus maximus TaxID=52904 RepID=A0A6A4RNI3_SCOMX|nr:hypothetical protein F2P81_024043 [Scophthalmus maximus]